MAASARPPRTPPTTPAPSRLIMLTRGTYPSLIWCVLPGLRGLEAHPTVCPRGRESDTHTSRFAVTERTLHDRLRRYAPAHGQPRGSAGRGEELPVRQGLRADDRPRHRGRGRG